MKNNRTIKTIVATVCVMTVLFVGFVTGMNKAHAEQIDELATTYEMRIMGLNEDNNKLIKVNHELRSDMSELEYQVYRMKSGEEYKVTVHVDDETHVYEGVSNGLFIQKTHTTIK